MAHMVETMAYTGDVPWHGLGTFIKDAPNVDQMLVTAGLDWTVDLRPISLQATGDAIPDFYALTRDRDNKVMDIVGNRYKPIQNAEAFEFFNEFVQAGNATMETAGSLLEGKRVWGLARLGSDFELAAGDKVNGYLLVCKPHEQGKSLIIKFTTVRVVCNNTITLALNTKSQHVEFRMAHRQAFDEKMIRHAKEVLGIAREQMSEFEANARKLHALELKKGEVIDIFRQIYQPEASNVELINKFDETATPTLAKVVDIYHRAPGAEVGTGWGALNAVTYFADHVASRSTDRRLTNAWFGKTARQKEQALDLLLKKAA